MPWLVLFAYVLALAVWLGQVVFFSFVVAPEVFGSLPVEQAGALISQLFSFYHAIGYLCGVILVGCALLLRRWSRPGGGPWLVAAVIAGLALLASLYAGLAVQPRAGALRPQLHQPGAPPAVRAEFDDLHRLAVELNGGVLLATLALAGLLAAQLASGVQVRRKPPRRTSDLQW